MAKKKAAKKTSQRNVKRKLLKKTVKRKIISPSLEREINYPTVNLEGNALAGVLHKAKKKSGTIIIVLHGFLGSKNNLLLKQACIEVARAGFDAYRVDLSGNGDSEGRFEDATPSKLLRDIIAIVEHFRKSYTKIILLGHSLGGSLSVIAASKLHLQGIIVIAPPTVTLATFDERKFTPTQREQVRSVGFTTITKPSPYGAIPYTITDEFLQQIKTLDVIGAAPNVHCPALIIHGTADLAVPTSDSEALLGHLFKRDILLVGGADHLFTSPQHLDVLIARVIAWLQKNS